MSTSSKIKSLEDLAVICRGCHNTRVVHCHGCFDLLHLGHIRYFQEAKTFGDLLIVTVTSDEFVRKGSDRPIFAGHLRIEAIAALECVDYVALNQWPTAVETIKLLKPNVYVKGPECATKKTPGLLAEEMTVLSIGGEIKYTSGEIWSSTDLINLLRSVQ